MGPRRRQKPELTGCHDCGKPVSFTAAHCPSCGSKEPLGPYRFSRREARRLRAEYKNDKTMLVVTLGCACAGAFYGYSIGAGPVSAIFTAIFYAAIGLLVGPPLGFAVNITRRLG